jgi:hypothetical protein
MAFFKVSKWDYYKSLPYQHSKIICKTSIYRPGLVVELRNAENV